MLKRSFSAPLVVSIIALCFSVVGSGIASVATISALSKKEKKQTRKIAKREINKAAPALSVQHAGSADSATTANTAASVADGAVTDAKLANGAVTSAKVANGSLRIRDLAIDRGTATAVHAGPLNGNACFTVSQPEAPQAQPGDLTVLVPSSIPNGIQVFGMTVQTAGTVRFRYCNTTDAVINNPQIDYAWFVLRG
jgi:hypothetical protein